MSFSPTVDCDLCPRLVAFREENQRRYPDFFNGVVPSFGSLDARILVVGLAPGLKGANRTGRPFTGDYAGDVLYKSLLDCGLATGNYARRKNDGLQLCGVRITNAVRCVPPQNKPELSETKRCSEFLANEILAMSGLKVIVSLGSVAHRAVIMAMELKQKDYPFGHGNIHNLIYSEGKKRILLDSYHCSRYNINTNRLTQEMFNEVMERAKELAFCKEC